MSDNALQDKLAYFKEQELLDISDDETGFPDEGLLNVERAFADTKAMPPPPRLDRQTSSFLGPTPKQRQAEFEAYTVRQRASTRVAGKGLVRPATAPEADVDVASNFHSTKATGKASPRRAGTRLKRNTSLPDLATNSHVEDEVLFYKRLGVVPRELKNGKNVKQANNIKVLPEHLQLLKGRIIYFYPNDDISMARRQRIHKVIQYGAAWVTRWRDDITHVMFDDPEYTYPQLLKHLNRSGLPRRMILVKYQPYVPEWIQFTTIPDPTSGRFQVKGAPKPTAPTSTPEPSSQASSQGSLQIKLTRKQLEIQNTPRTDSRQSTDSFPPSHPPSDGPLEEFGDIVEDSFIQPSSDPVTPLGKPEEVAKYLKSYDDGLAEAIKQTKAISHLPIDEDEDDDSSSSSFDPEAAVERLKANYSGPKKFVSASTNMRKNSKSFNQLAFQCMDPRATNASAFQNPNARTIQILDDMCKYYDQLGDTWRTIAYRRAISTLHKQKTKICTKEQAEILQHIGPRMAKKIEEIVLTDRLRRLDSTRDDPTDKILRLFMGVYGAGPSQANKWIQQGYQTLDDLVRKAKLTDSQKVGVEHYEDFATRIPRVEVEAHGAFVRNALQKMDPGYEVYVMGSYRRGAKDSGDIDLIITKAKTPLSTLRTIVFGSLVPKLFAANFLKVALATHRSNDGSGTKWHGASCLPSSNTWRRLDLLLVPEEEMGAALIYFTGNDIFNRSMRLLASKKGMRLNQRGLYEDVMRGEKRKKLTEGTLVEGRSEKRIFEVLGVPWRGPEERIC